MFQGTYRDKTVLLTGHTGFKGAWLAEWLLGLGARVVGFSLDVPTTPALFDQLGLAKRLGADDLRGDVRDLPALRAAVNRARPDFVFHLAAQPLVRLSYADPVGTFTTNVTGTVNLLEAVRTAGLERPCAVVIVTTDKCYENREWLHAYREEDPMGGHDPYSASKGAAELAVAAYRRSFFHAPLAPGATPVAVASARAGNVIGGGDWATDRIVPDCVRALRAGEAIPVRNKTSTRPWQHVLEPLGGYLLLGQRLHAALAGRDARTLEFLAAPFNFGPQLDSNRTVARLVTEILGHWPGAWLDRSDPDAPHEAGRLNLTIDKAFHLLGWAPTWNFSETIAATVEWYRQAGTLPAAELTELTRGQIHAYADRAATLGLAWAAVDAKTV